jgi:accessory colonization factor AcfC
MKIQGLVKAKKNGDIYAYHGDQKFTNISRGGKGKLSKEDSQKLFVIPITLNRFAEENPNIINLITSLSLSIEPLTTEEEFERINYLGKSLE